MENLLYNSLYRYFSTLGAVGYVSYDSVYRLILLRFMNRFLNYDFVGVVSEKDYKDIDRMLDCLFGICLIPYDDYAMENLNVGCNVELLKRIQELEKKLETLEKEGVPEIPDNSLLDRVRRLEEEPVVLWQDDFQNP